MLSSKNLDLSAVDLTSADSAIAFADRLCETANTAGIFLREGDPERDAATCKLARRTAKDWLKSVRKHIDGMTVSDALRLLPSYDTLHRVAYGTPADPAFLNKHVMGAFESRIRGNKEVDPYLLYRQINAGIARRDPLYLGRPLAWSTTMLDRWYKDLSNHTPLFIEINSPGVRLISRVNSYSKENSLYHLLQKASILMETDLWVYEGENQKAFKQQLFNSYRECFFQLESYDRNTLMALRTFLNATRSYIPQEDLKCCHDALRGGLIYPENKRTKQIYIC